jgi:hypothetical protein
MTDDPHGVGTILKLVRTSTYLFDPLENLDFLSGLNTCTLEGSD